MSEGWVNVSNVSIDCDNPVMKGKVKAVCMRNSPNDCMIDDVDGVKQLNSRTGIVEI